MNAQTIETSPHLSARNHNPDIHADHWRITDTELLLVCINGGDHDSDADLYDIAIVSTAPEHDGMVFLDYIDEAMTAAHALEIINACNAVAWECDQTEFAPDKDLASAAWLAINRRVETIVVANASACIAAYENAKA